jgi:hypothetical protein
MRGQFPPQVQQIFITIPARIDDSLANENERGYTFLAREGFQWTITLTAPQSGEYQLVLYGKTGQVLAQAIGNSQTPASLTWFIDEEGLYAVYITGVTGDYTFSILP